MTRDATESEIEVLVASLQKRTQRLVASGVVATLMATQALRFGLELAHLPREVSAESAAGSAGLAAQQALQISTAYTQLLVFSVLSTVGAIFFAAIFVISLARTGQADLLVHVWKRLRMLEANDSATPPNPAGSPPKAPPP